MNENLYIIPRFNKKGEVVKTHLARASRVFLFLDGNNPVIEKLCLRNVPILLCTCGCFAKCDCDGTEARLDWAEYWDKYFNEVSCPTCLKIARDGYGHGQLAMSVGVNKEEVPK